MNGIYEPIDFFYYHNIFWNQIHWNSLCFQNKSIESQFQMCKQKPMNLFIYQNRLLIFTNSLINLSICLIIIYDLLHMPEKGSPLVEFVTGLSLTIIGGLFEIIIYNFDYFKEIK